MTYNSVVSILTGWCESECHWRLELATIVRHRIELDSISVNIVSAVSELSARAGQMVCLRRSDSVGERRAPSEYCTVLHWVV